MTSGKSIEVARLLTFEEWKLERQMNAVIDGIKLAQAGAAPETQEEAEARSVDVQMEGGGTETIVFQQEEIDARKQAYYWANLEAQSERRRLVWKIDTWLAQRGSPMAGCGECYVANGERTGIPACLSVGIAEAESSSGMACFAPHNAWGMLAYPGGWSSWEEGITANFDWLVRYYGCPQSMYECPGYCEGNGTMGNVDRVQRYIENMDASEVY